jgi:SAM-dependent methyltransferase
MTDPRDLDWQRRYEQNDTPWDKGAPAPALQRYLQGNAISGRVLVPGCGHGHEVRALAERPACSAVGLDLSSTAIAEANRFAVQPGVGSSVTFVTGDFFQLTPEMTGTFDWLVEHTCFCAIEPRLRPDYARAAASALRTGGKIFGIFYLNPETESGPPFAVTREELARLFAADFMLREEWLPAESFPGREGREWVRILQKRQP